MLGLPQPASNTSSQIPTIDFPDPSDILKPFIQYLYPRPPPKVIGISMWPALYAVADKYNVEVVTELLRAQEAKIASRRTLTMDILSEFPQEEAELMGGAACQRLVFLHLNRREAARALVAKHPLPSSRSRHCICPPSNYNGLVPALCHHVATRPWLTAEGLYEEVGKRSYPPMCDSEDCRYAIKNMCAYFTSLLKGISDLPQTI